MILDGFPRTRPRPRRSTAPSAARASAWRGALYVDVPDGGAACGASSGRWVCRRQRPHLPRDRPARPASRASATSTAPSSTSAPTTGRRPSRPGWPAAGAHGRGRRATTPSAASSRGRRRAARSTRSPTTLLRGRSAQPIALTMAVLERRVTLKSQRQIEQMRRGRPASSPTSWPGRARAPAGRHHRSSSTRIAEALHPRARRRALVHRRAWAAQRRTGHALCVSIDDEIVHGIPGKRRIGGRPGRVGRRRRDRRRLARRRRPHVRSSARCRRAARARWSTRPALALMAGIAAAQPGNHIGDISAAVEDVALRARLRHRARVTWATASAPRCTRTPQVPNYRTRQPGRRSSSRACAWPSSRCSPSAARRLADARRRLDRRHPDGIAGRPLRAHDRRSRRTVRAILTTAMRPASGRPLPRDRRSP